MRGKKLNLSEISNLMGQFSADFLRFAESSAPIPEQLSYSIISSESPSIVRTARCAALNTMTPGFTKVAFDKSAIDKSAIDKSAFDTRRINQTTQRIPRENLQNWHRSEEFIPMELHEKLAKLNQIYKIATDLKSQFETKPEWHSSYARVLYDTLHEILRIEQADQDYSLSSIAYIEQLLESRYRIRLETMKESNNDQIKTSIISKDESLLKRGLTERVKSEVKAPESKAQINGDALATLFGGERQPGVERTITITIRDSLIDG